MNDMKRYLMKYKGRPEVIHGLADRVGVSRIYLTQIASGHGRASGILARRLDEETDCEIRKGSLRPDIFGSVETLKMPVAVDAENLSPIAGN